MAGQDVTTLAVTGNEAVAEAMRQINPDVVCAYPITPQTEVVQLYAQMVADGTVDTEFVTVESEHSAMSAAIGSAAGGARTMTATSSQGFALMWELLYVAASYRLPIVMTTVNRALSGPINIHCDHSDTMGGRDTGLDPDLRREPPAGLRQLPAVGPHRGAHGRAHPHHAHVRRLRHQRGHRSSGDPRRREGPAISSAPTRPSTPCSTSSIRSRWAPSTACTAGTSSTRWRRTGPWTGPST